MAFFEGARGALCHTFSESNQIQPDTVEEYAAAGLAVTSRLGPGGN